MSRGACLRFLGALAVGIVFATAACAPGSEHNPPPTGPADGGPVPGTEPHVWSVKAGNVGEVFSDGFETFQNTGAEPATIVSVTPDGADKALEFLGARLGMPGRRDDFNQRMPGYPPAAVARRFQVPAEGATLEPGAVYMLILGYRITADAYDVRDSVTVRYRVGAAEFERVIPAFLVACPTSRSEDDCLASVTSNW